MFTKRIQGRAWARAWAGLLTAGLAAPAAGQGFTDGDLYLLTAGLIPGGAAATAQDSISGYYLSDERFHYFVDGIPDFDQKRESSPFTIGLPNDGRFYCAPTAATNLMAWLANNGAPGLPPGGGDWSLYTESRWNNSALERYNTATNAIDAMGEAMSTNPDGGTDSYRVLHGVRDYLDEHLPDHEYRVYQRGVDGGDWVSHRFHIPAMDEAAEVLIDGAVAIMRWGYYDWTDVFVGGDQLIRRTGGHLVAVMGIDRVAGETYVRVRNPGSSDSPRRQSDFSVSRYRVEAVPFVPPGGEGATTKREVLMRPNQSWEDFTSGNIKCIDEFTFITPRDGFSVADTLDGIRFHRLDPFSGSIETVTADLPFGDPIVNASITTSQLGALLLVEDDGASRLVAFDLDAGTFTDVAVLGSAKTSTSTRHDTVIVLGEANELTHISPFDPDDPVLAQGPAGDDGDHLDADDETDTLWMLSTTSSTVSSFTLPDLAPVDQMFLPSAFIWVEPIDFAVSPRAESIWIVNDGTVREVRIDQMPPAEVLYPTPFPAQAIDVDESGTVAIAMANGATRLVRRFLPDFDAGTLTPLPSTLLEGLTDIGLDFQLSTSSTNVDPALYENPGSGELDIDTIMGTFNDPEPPPAGEWCEAVDDLENLSQGEVVMGRTVDGVAIELTTAAGAAIRGRTWSAGTGSLYGAGDEINQPFAPGLVSGARFMSSAVLSQGVGFIEHQPIRFEFAEPVAGFGLTTVDLLEGIVGDAETVALRAYDAAGQLVGEHLRAGPQGPSGVVLRWHVQSETANIVRVELGGTLAHGGGYGLDDLELCRGVCRADLDGDGEVGVLDLIAVLAAWGQCAGCVPDIDGDGTVGLSDLLAVLAAWGECP
jgi:hypothetical protein